MQAPDLFIGVSFDTNNPKSAVSIHDLDDTPTAAWVRPCRRSAKWVLTDRFQFASRQVLSMYGDVYGRFEVTWGVCKCVWRDQGTQSFCHAHCQNLFLTLALTVTQSELWSRGRARDIPGDCGAGAEGHAIHCLCRLNRRFAEVVLPTGFYRSCAISKVLRRIMSR